MAELSIRYATALFESAMEKGLLDEYLEQSVFLKDILQAKECRHIIEHPQFTTDERHAFFKEAFDGRIHNDLLGLMYLVVDKNRESFLVPALDAFIAMGDKHNRKTTAELTSAVELTEAQVLKLKELLERKLDKQVEMVLKVDPSVIGGFNVYVDGYFVDCTIKKQLSNMVDFIKGSAPNDSKT